MRRLTATAATLTLLFSFATSSAQAQEPPPPPGMVEVPTPPPPPAAALPPPRWLSPISGRELEHRGHTLKLTGALLMGLGSAVVVGGILMTALDDSCHSSHFCGARGDLYAPGTALTYLGAAAIGAGIPTYIVGGAKVDKGRRLQLNGFAAAPTIGAGSSSSVNGFSANASFRF